MQKDRPTPARALKILGGFRPSGFLSLWHYNNGRENRIFSCTSFQLKFLMCFFRVHDSRLLTICLDVIVNQCRPNYNGILIILFHFLSLPLMPFVFVFFCVCVSYFNILSLFSLKQKCKKVWGLEPTQPHYSAGPGSDPGNEKTNQTDHAGSSHSGH